MMPASMREADSPPLQGGEVLPYAERRYGWTTHARNEVGFPS
jgi:hypothetical protein